MSGGCTSSLLTPIDACQVVQLYEEYAARMDSDADRYDSPIARNAPKNELVGLLEEYFDGPEQVEFAYHLVVAAHGGGV